MRCCTRRPGPGQRRTAQQGVASLAARSACTPGPEVARACLPTCLPACPRQLLTGNSSCKPPTVQVLCPLQQGAGRQGRIHPRAAAGVAPDVERLQARPRGQQLCRQRCGVVRCWVSTERTAAPHRLVGSESGRGDASAALAQHRDSGQSCSPPFGRRLQPAWSELAAPRCCLASKRGAVPAPRRAPHPTGAAARPLPAGCGPGTASAGC